jgi:hypothetical protein
MSTTFRPIRTMSLVTILSAAAAAAPGCGESPPPPPTPEAIETGKKDREVIIQKEYGQAAFQKGQAAEKARSK